MQLTPSEPAVPPEHIGTQEVPIAPESVIHESEVQDVNLRGIVWFAVALIIAAVIIHIVLWWVLQIWTGDSLMPRIQVSPALVTPQPVPGPGLQAAPDTDFDIWFAAELERLQNYGWVDREGNKVHIPIEQAMEMLLQQELPAREGTAPDFGLEPAYQLDSSGGILVEPEGAE